MRRLHHERIDANPFVVMSDLFITLSFILILLLLAVALSSSSALEQIQVNTWQEDLASKARLAMRGAMGADALAITQDGNLQRFYFPSEILFGEGRWDIQPSGMQCLAQFAAVLSDWAASGHVASILVEGHTDTTPMHPNLIRRGVRSSWDLSLLRAVEVTRYLQAKGVPPHLLSAAGRGEWSPRDTNATDVGRQHNRRIEIVLVYNTPSSEKENSHTLLPVAH